MKKDSTKAPGMRLFGPPPLLEGEDAAAYFELAAQVSADINPSDVVERICVRDFVDITIDILRLRRLRSTVLMAAVSDARDRAVKPVVDEERDRLLRALWKEQEQQQEEDQPELSSEDWKKRAEQDPAVAQKLTEVRTTAESALDMDVMTARAFVNELEHIERIDRLTMIAEGRRNAILREIDRRRALFAAQVLRDKVQKIEAVKFKTREPKAIAKPDNDIA